MNERALKSLFIWFGIAICRWLVCKYRKNIPAKNTPRFTTACHRSDVILHNTEYVYSSRLIMHTMRRAVNKGTRTTYRRLTTPRWKHVRLQSNNIWWMIILWPMDQPRLRLHTMRRAIKKAHVVQPVGELLCRTKLRRVKGCYDIIWYYCLRQNTYVRTEIIPASMIEHKVYP